MTLIEDDRSSCRVKASRRQFINTRIMNMPKNTHVTKQMIWFQVLHSLTGKGFPKIGLLTVWCLLDKMTEIKFVHKCFIQYQLQNQRLPMSTALRLEVQQQIKSIGTKRTAPQLNPNAPLNFDDIISYCKTKRHNKSRYHQQFKEIFAPFDRDKIKYGRRMPLEQFVDSLNSKMRMRTDESIEAPLLTSRRTYGPVIDIQRIIETTSPIRLNYENFKTFQETVRKSIDEGNSDNLPLAHFGTVTTNEETDEEIEKIQKCSNDKFKLQNIQTGLSLIFALMEKKYKRNARLSLLETKAYVVRKESKINAVYMVINVLKEIMRKSIVQLSKCPKRGYKQRAVQFNLRLEDEKSDQFLKEISNIPRSIGVTMHFEDFLKQQSQNKNENCK